MIGFGTTDFSSVLGNIYGASGGVRGLDLAQMEPGQILLLIIAIIGLALIFFSEGNGSSSSSGGKYKGSDLKVQAIDESADRYQVVLKESGKELFKGTKEQCNKWKRENSVGSSLVRR